MQKKFIYIGIAAILVIGFLIWLFQASSQPLPGTKIADLGRGHVPIGTKVDYNSNPPTSGKHYQEWTRAGVYSEPKDDRNLVHSLEHGYVILSYKCNLEVKTNNLPKAEQMSKLKTDEEATEGGEASPSGQFDTQGQCDEKKNQLSKVYEKRDKRKLIIVPRPSLDTNFALTAWDYLDKFNEFDEQRVTNFIDTQRDQGPERTME